MGNCHPFSCVSGNTGAVSPVVQVYKFKTLNSIHFHRASLAQQLAGWFNWAQSTCEEQEEYFQQLLEGRESSKVGAATASGPERAGGTQGCVGSVAGGDAGHVCPDSVNFLSLAPGAGCVQPLPPWLAVPELQALLPAPHPALAVPTSRARRSSSAPGPAVCSGGSEQFPALTPLCLQYRSRSQPAIAPWPPGDPGLV